MPYVETRQTVKQPAEKIWEVIGDFANIAKFHPIVTRSTLTAGDASAAGGQRTCTLKDGAQLKERLLSYNDGRSYQVEIVDFGTFPMKKAVVTIGVDEGAEANTSTVFMSNDFLPKMGGPVGWVMGKMMSQQFDKLNKKIIDHAVYYAQNGEKPA